MLADRGIHRRPSTHRSKRKKKANTIYYYVVESARVDGKPRIVHQTYLGTADVSPFLPPVVVFHPSTVLRGRVTFTAMASSSGQISSGGSGSI
jgi:hypothetical protein